MSSITAGRAAARDGAYREASWWAALGVEGRRAFRAAFAGYMLDAFDLIVLTLSLAAIGTTFGVGTGATGALSTVTLSASAIGGILGGVLGEGSAWIAAKRPLLVGADNLAWDVPDV